MVAWMEVRISAKAFAEFVVGGPGKKSSTIRKILKPKSPEAKIPIGYYRRAIAIIRGYHDQDNDADQVRAEVKILAKEAESAETKQARAKRLCNLLAVELYMKAFANRTWKVTRCPRIHYTSSEVRISGTPDLAIQDSKRLRLVKLGVRKEKETPDMVRIMLRVIYQAAKKKITLDARDVTYFNVRTGEAISGDASDRRLASTIDNGCSVLQQMIRGKTI